MGARVSLLGVGVYTSSKGLGHNDTWGNGLELGHQYKPTFVLIYMYVINMGIFIDVCIYMG